MKTIKKFRIFENIENSENMVNGKFKKIYVLIGPPSVGKSTWIKNTFSEIEPFVINRDDIVEKVAVEYGWTYDDLFSLPIKDIEKEGDMNRKYGTVIKSPAYMTWSPLSYDKVLEANDKVQDIFKKRVAEGKGKENIVVDMTNMNSESRKVALKIIEGIEGEYHKVAVLFSFKGAEETIKKMAAKRSEEMKAQGKSKTIPPATFDRVFASFQEVSTEEGFDEVINVDNTAELKRAIEESEKKTISESVNHKKNTIMNHIKLFENFLNESVDKNDIVHDIVDTMLDFIDEGEKISFYSASGNMNYNDYLDKNSNYQKFKPVLKAGNKIISKFNIVYVPKNKSYDGVVEIMDNMKSTIGRLGEDGWVLNDFVTKSNKGDSYDETCKINYVEFIFSKADVILDDKEFELPDEDDLREAIENQGIHIQSIEIGDSETVLEFSDYDDFGAMNSESWYNKRFETICDLFGFGSYDLDYRRATVTFEY